jgi:hypothetical protein
MSTSAGWRGYRKTFSKKGVRTTASIPGTGTSYTEYTPNRAGQSSKRANYRALVTREEAEKFWNIRPLVNTPTNRTKNFGMSKLIKFKENRNNISNRKEVQAC